MKFTILGSIKPNQGQHINGQKGKKGVSWNNIFLNDLNTLLQGEKYLEEDGGGSAPVCVPLYTPGLI